MTVCSLVKVLVNSIISSLLPALGRRTCSTGSASSSAPHGSSTSKRWSSLAEFRRYPFRDAPVPRLPSCRVSSRLGSDCSVCLNPDSPAVVWSWQEGRAQILGHSCCAVGCAGIGYRNGGRPLPRSKWEHSPLAQKRAL